MDQTQKLVEVGDGKVTIEMTGTQKFGGKETPIRARKLDIKQMYNEGDVHIEKEGDEDIEIAGKPYKCHWIEMTIKSGPNPGKIKAWLSLDVPGGGIKAEVTPPNNQGTFVITAVEWEKK